MSYGQQTLWMWAMSTAWMFTVKLSKKPSRRKMLMGLPLLLPFSSETDGLAVKEALKRTDRLMQRYEKPVVFCMVTNKDQWLPMKEVTEFQTFTDIDDALKALTLSLERFNHLDRMRLLAEQICLLHDRPRPLSLQIYRE